MDLSNELIERILQFVLVADRPVEFAPLTVKNRSIANDNLPPSRNNRHVAYYIDTVRPKLAVLRVCKLFSQLGARVYYGKNEFRFSSPRGTYMLACFLRHIGVRNTALLRDVTVVFPLCARIAQSVRASKAHESHGAVYAMLKEIDIADEIALSTPQGFSKAHDLLKDLQRLHKHFRLTVLLYRPTWMSIARTIGSEHRRSEQKLMLVRAATSVSTLAFGETTSTTRVIHLIADPSSACKFANADEKPEDSEEYKSGIAASSVTLKEAGLRIRDMTCVEYDPVEPVFVS